MEAVPLHSQSQQLQDSLADLGQRYQWAVNAEGISASQESRSCFVTNLTGNRGGASFILNEWTTVLSRNPSEAVISVFVHQIRDAGVIAGDRRKKTRKKKEDTADLDVLQNLKNLSVVRITAPVEAKSEGVEASVADEDLHGLQAQALSASKVQSEPLHNTPLYKNDRLVADNVIEGGSGTNVLSVAETARKPSADEDQHGTVNSGFQNSKGLCAWAEYIDSPVGTCYVSYVLCLFRTI